MAKKRGLAIIFAAGGLGLGLWAFLSRKAKAVPPGVYTCPHCGLTFSTYDELVAHVQNTHPGERIPIDIHWE